MPRFRLFGRKRDDGFGNPVVEFTPITRQVLRLDGLRQSYSTIYRTQPAVRTVVDFLARNIAQLNLKTYRRVSRTDRREEPDHPLAQLIQSPNPLSTRYRMIHGTICDLAIYDNAYWWKRETAGKRALVRIPPGQIRPEESTLLAVSQYALSDGTLISANDVVHFRGYDPDDPRVGMSPLESLRQVLSEDLAASRHREHFWANAARIEGLIERPSTAPEWSEVARERFRKEWQGAMSGANNAGKTAILEDDMKWKDASFSPKDSEFIAGRKLTREEVARAYHIPLPMVGILDNATFSNITEQHKMLYVDTIGPWLAMLEEEIELQLFPWFTDTQDLYVEFNIAEKLQGSFAEQAQVLTTAVGRAWMVPNEARALVNLPRIEDPQADELGTPLNVLVGGQPAPTVEVPAATNQTPRAAAQVIALSERFAE